MGFLYAYRPLAVMLINENTKNNTLLANIIDLNVIDRLPGMHWRLHFQGLPPWTH